MFQMLIKLEIIELINYKIKENNCETLVYKIINLSYFIFLCFGKEFVCGIVFYF